MIDLIAERKSGYRAKQEAEVVQFTPEQDAKIKDLIAKRLAKGKV